MRLSSAIVGLLATLLACAPELRVSSSQVEADTPRANAPTSEVERLRAFAKLYGYVRFFHPSDSAAAADWDLLAVEGARLALAAEERVDLERALTSWLEGVAQTPHVYIEEEGAQPLVLFEGTTAISEDPRVPNVAWQHLGFGQSLVGFPYESRRLRRIGEHPYGRDVARISQTMDGACVRGQRVRLRAAIRIETRGSSDAGSVWLEVDRPDTSDFWSVKPDPRATLDGSWQVAAVEADIPNDATSLSFGGSAFGVGTVWFDDFELAILDDGDPRPIELVNPGFEARLFTPWTMEALGFTVDVPKRAAGHALRIERRFVRDRGALFGPRPKPNEVLDLPLGAGLRVQLPISLPEVFARQSLGQPPACVVPLPGLEDPAVRAASVIVAWNVLNHFYPYFDVIHEDWEAVLDETIVDVLDDRDVEDLDATLDRLVAKLHDGHGFVSRPAWSSPEGQLRLRFTRIEDKVIAVIAAPDLGVERGDQVLEIDGVDVEAKLREAATRVSGTPQFVEFVLLDCAVITRGPLGSMVALTLERGGERIELELERSAPQLTHPVFARPPIERFDDGVIWVDLARISPVELRRLIPELAAARGVVFDVREYPSSEPEILLDHLLRASIRDPADWMFVPQIIYPDHAISSWDGRHWPLVAKKPHIGGRVVFITGPGAISGAESLLGLVEGYGLGEIIGSPTAGTNGNIVDFAVPGGFTIRFTGGKVTRVDGRQHHLIGIEPTIPATPTIEGFLAGRDEVLEVALAVARGER